MNTNTSNRNSNHVVEFTGKKAECESFGVFKCVALDSLIKNVLQKYKYKYEMKSREGIKYRLESKFIQNLPGNGRLHAVEIRVSLCSQNILNSK